ncbi:T cell receptor beta chain MC.7.G5-like [Melanerpes formicivorus]|uniref:T cell receptor beta chain MC.7.G5-like n=1 Tax=Melanerpes formicivorus TaxID=211600 RepID=UPI00358FA4F7
MVLQWFLMAILVPVGQALHQSPDMAVRVGDSVALDCSRRTKDFFAMYWYKLPVGKDAALQLVVYSLEGRTAEIEEKFRSHVQSNGTKDSRLSMKIDHALLNDSGTYFCAEQDTQGEVFLQLQSSVNNERLNFGSGTKLTVIGKNDKIIPPAVAIFSPSKQEIQQKKKATLVCLASGFYPDYVDLAWKVNGAERTEGVGTDEFSTQNGSTYSLTSRLRISAYEWFNPSNNFECVAKFFENGTSGSIRKFIYGDAGCALTEESYLRYGNSLKLTYLVLCGKALLYAIFLSALLWRVKVGGSCRENK